MTPFTRTRDDLAACVLVYTILASSVADWALTVFGLQMGAQELNPFMAAAFEAGIGYALAFKVTLPLYAGICYRIHRSPEWRRLWLGALGLVAAISLSPVVWNLYMLGRIR